VTQVLHSLLPIALLVLTGALLLRLRFFGDAFRRGLDRLVYWVALPALIVGELAQAPVMGERAGPMIAVFAGATLLTALLAWALAWAMRLPAASVGVFVQAAHRGNLAFVGLPVILLASEADDQSTRALAALVFAPIVLLYNVLAVLALTLAHHRFDRHAPLKLLRSLVTNPLLLACGLGLALNLLQLQTPTPLIKTLVLLGQPAAPLALISLGGAVVTYRVHRHAAVGFASATLKLAVLPAITLLLAGVLGLDPQQRLIVLIFSATPTAVASYVLAVQLRGDPGVAAATIVISTILSFASLAAALALA